VFAKGAAGAHWKERKEVALNRPGRGSGLILKVYCLAFEISRVCYKRQAAWVGLGDPTWLPAFSPVGGTNRVASSAV
jgi:hypothetical protein